MIDILTMGLAMLIVEPYDPVLCYCSIKPEDSLHIFPDGTEERIIGVRICYNEEKRKIWEKDNYYVLLMELAEYPCGENP